MILRLPSFLLSPFIGGAWAVTYGHLILVKKADYIQAEEYWLIPHEQLHQQRQLAYGYFKWWWRYNVDKAFRIAEEVLAYRLSVEKGLPLEGAIYYLVNNYKVSMTNEEAQYLLTRPDTTQGA